MRRTILLYALLGLSTVGAYAETTQFAGGVVDVTWTDTGALAVRVTLDHSAQAGSASSMWVLTLNALRFPDGIYAWQLHLSPLHQSIVVIPNDFLTAQRFTLAQVGVDVVDPVSLWNVDLLIPRTGAIPQLVAPGDMLEIHALWIQQRPLVAVRIPDELETGGGAQSDRRGAGASPYMPGKTSLVIGTPIRQSFLLIDEDAGRPMDGAYARIALVRITESLAEVLVDYVYCEPSSETGLVTYEFDTGDLEPGMYDLIVWVDPPGAATRQRLELLSAAP